MKLVQPYQSGWAADFLLISSELAKILEGTGCVVEHIGSTAVSGLAAKSIIDIDIALPESIEVKEVVSRLAFLGYTHVGDQGVAQREAFKRLDPGTKHPVLDRIAHHLYVCPFGSPELHRHLAFRDYLRTHERAREEYASLKQEIARAANQDRKTYAVLKEERAKDFVESILAFAEREDQGAGTQVQGEV